MHAYKTHRSNAPFANSEQFFSLPESVKSKTSFKRSENFGWETRSQIRPSTGVPDQKESIQLQYHRQNSASWPSTDNAPAGFTAATTGFMEKCHTLSMQILSLFATELGFPSDFFDRAHLVSKSNAQSTLRLLHYHEITGTQLPANYWRTGAHTDFDCLTLVFQRTGEDGLEICPGREAHSSFGIGDQWTPIEACTGEIVCNIGDMLMAWSDDRFKSLFHRVRCPGVGENQRSRYSIA